MVFVFVCVVLRAFVMFCGWFASVLSVLQYFHKTRKPHETHRKTQTLELENTKKLTIRTCIGLG